MGTQQFCLRWNNHQVNLLSVFDKLLSKEAFVDVTIACEGSNIKAHKMILSACSPFFEDLFADNPCKHPIVIMKDMKFDDLKAIIEFMYKGEVNVSQDKLSALLRSAEALKIKGLTDMLGDQTLEAELDHQKVYEMGSTQANFLPTSLSPPPVSRPTKRRKRKPSGEMKAPMNRKSPSPENIEEFSKSPSNGSNKDTILPADVIKSEASVQAMHAEGEESIGDSGASIENGSARNQHMLDPSSFMQQSLTENQAYDQQRQLDYDNHENSRSHDMEEHVGMNSNSSHQSASPADSIKIVKQENMADSFYVEDVTHILPQPKQELIERGVTIVPLANQSDSVSGSQNIDDMEYCGLTRDHYSPSKDSEAMISLGQPVSVDAYPNMSTDVITQAASGAIILTGHGEEAIAGPSEQTSPGRSPGTGARFHASVIADILFRVNGTVCPLCSRNFSSKMSLVRHVRCIHTDLDSIQKHQCHLCGKSYVRKDKLHDHLASAHQLTLPGKQPIPGKQQPKP